MTIKKLTDHTRCTDVLGKCAFYFRRRTPGGRSRECLNQGHPESIGRWFGCAKFHTRRKAVEKGPAQDTAGESGNQYISFALIVVVNGADCDPGFAGDVRYGRFAVAFSGEHGQGCIQYLLPALFSELFFVPALTSHFPLPYDD